MLHVPAPPAVLAGEDERDESIRREAVGPKLGYTIVRDLDNGMVSWLALGRTAVQKQRTYVLGFCRQRGIPTEGIRLRQRMHADPSSGMVTDVDIAIELPETFPPRYVEAVVRAADQCAVKKHFERPPRIHVTSVLATTIAA